MQIYHDNKIIYHGTNERFDRFECPAYFTDDIHTAEFFARRNSGENIVMLCEVNLQNPLIVDIEGQSWGGFVLEDEELQKGCIEYAAAGDEEELEYFNEQGITVNFLAGYAETLGYDGLIVNNCYEENGSCATQYVAFYPEQIRIVSRDYIVQTGHDEPGR